MRTDIALQLLDCHAMARANIEQSERLIGLFTVELQDARQLLAEVERLLIVHNVPLPPSQRSMVQ